MVGFDEAFRASLGYFNGDEIAAEKFVKKYALRDRAGDYKELTPADMHRRLAREFARIEKKHPNPMSEDEIFDLLDRFRYVIPQGSPMSGIGNTYQVQSISNCFVIPPPLDSYGAILNADQQLVQIMKRRGGVGLDISGIRPKGLSTENAAETTDGICIFMERFSNSCREVAQGGRRGALMLSISCHHPQVRDFINIKRDLRKVTGANVSVRLTDEFMRAVEAGTTVQLRFPVDAQGDDITVSTDVDARGLWDEMIASAHECAEPGLMFWDTIISRSPADIYADEGFRTTSSNPCAELPLGNDSCRLMVVNLMSFVDGPFTEDAAFDWNKFSDVVMKAQRLMDDIVDLEVECIDRIIRKVDDDPEPEHIKRVELDMWRMFRDTAVRGRRTGLGPTAVGDMLAALGIRYGSDASIELVERVYRELALASYVSSAQLAAERGAFAVHDYEREKDHVFMRQLFDADPGLEDAVKKHGRRNIACNTTAPCGTVSLMTQTTSGIEPAFLLQYTRRTRALEGEKASFVDDTGDAWKEFDVFHHGFKKWMDVTGLSDVKQSPYWGATSADIDWRAKIRLQAAAQRWVDHSISNTTNIPEDTSIDVTRDIYMEGWKSGCKGVTVYREGSRSGILVKKDAFKQHSAPKRPQELPCHIHHMQVKGEAWTVLVGLLDGKPYEVFGGLARFVEIPKRYTDGILIKHPRKTTNSIYDLQFGFNGDTVTVKNIVEAFDNPNHSALTRILSLALRHGASINYAVEQLQKDKNADVFSFAKCIARVLKTYIEDGTSTAALKSCPQCSGEKFAYVEGCVSCSACGWSKCG